MRVKGRAGGAGTHAARRRAAAYTTAALTRTRQQPVREPGDEKTRAKKRRQRRAHEPKLTAGCRRSRHTCAVRSCRSPRRARGLRAGGRARGDGRGAAARACAASRHRSLPLRARARPRACKTRDAAAGVCVGDARESLGPADETMARTAASETSVETTKAPNVVVFRRHAMRRQRRENFIPAVEYMVSCGGRRSGGGRAQRKG